MSWCRHGIRLVMPYYDQKCIWKLMVYKPVWKLYWSMRAGMRVIECFSPIRSYKGDGNFLYKKPARYQPVDLALRGRCA